MKLMSYKQGERVGYGIVAGDGSDGPEIIPVDGDFARQFQTIRMVLDGNALESLKRWADGRSPSLSFADIRFLPPLHDAEKVICIGVNYPKRHPVHGEIPPPENITLFAKFEGSLVGHLEPLITPPEPASETFDYEGELVLVIGREGRFISKEAVFDHIAGYTIMNDGSVRGWQKHSVTAGKNFFAASASGPWMVTADEIDDPFQMKLSTRLNGEEVQSTTVSEMIFDIPAMVNYVSNFVHLKPGDIISTGSPAGSGGSRVPQRFLRPGDELEIEWSGIGVLKNKVVASDGPAI